MGRVNLLSQFSRIYMTYFCFKADVFTKWFHYSNSTTEKQNFSNLKNFFLPFFGGKFQHPQKNDCKKRKSVV